MISPILTYNSEVWGLFINSDFKCLDTSPIEKGHLQFCKRYLQVNNKASNIACRAELGRYPLIFDINKRILKYISYLLSPGGRGGGLPYETDGDARRLA